MKYYKAQTVLPAHIVEIIQQFVDGEFIYIPRKSGEKKCWGEKSGTKNELKLRNEAIFSDYTKGSTVSELSEKYYLSEQSIRRIVTQEKAR